MSKGNPNPKPNILAHNAKIGRGRGRPKGTKNRVPTEIKGHFLQVFETLQQNPKTSLLHTAKEDPAWFYELSKVLIPREIKGEFNGTISRIDIAIQAAQMVITGQVQPTLPAQPPAGPPQVGGVATGAPGLLTDGEE